MKLVIKKFAVNVSSWSNKELADFLNKLINPKYPDAPIKELSKDQINKIKDKLGNEPKLPATFKEIYQQFKSVELGRLGKVDEKAVKKDLNKLSDDLQADAYLEGDKLIVRDYDKAYGDGFTAYYETEVDKLKLVKYWTSRNSRVDKYAPTGYRLKTLEAMNKFAKSHQLKSLMLIVEFD